MRGADVRSSLRRVQLMRVALLVAFGVLALRAAHLSVVDVRGAERGQRQTAHSLTLAPERGSIFDRHGSVLALTIEAPSIYAVGREVAEPASVARVLARQLGLDRARTLRDLETRQGFRFVRRWVTPDQAAAIEAADLRGVGVVQEPRRIYPHRELVAPVVGFANIDGKGVRGIEQQEDAWLRGVTRRVSAERDGSGQLLVSSGATARGTAGGDVALTLDAALQAHALDALKRAVRSRGARGGLVLAMDPHTGEILTLAEWPGFDPNDFRNTPYAKTGSRAFLQASEPGSSMKAFLVAAALEAETAQPGQSLATDGGELRVPGKTIRDARDFGALTPRGVLRHSSNVGAVLLAQDLGRERHFQSLKGFGFGSSSGSLFPDESAGVLRPWDEWKPLDHATIAFGQGLSVTAVQLATAMSALANGGLLVRPQLVTARRAQEQPWQWARSQVQGRVISRDTARTVLRMMEAVVSDEAGTGRRAGLRGIRVAGKTGTAQKWDADEGRYSDTRFRAWFVGAAPVEAPRVVIVVQLDEPKRPHHTGGAAAAPLFAEVLEAQLAPWGIFPEPPPTRVASAPQPESRTRSTPKPAPQPAPAAPRPARQVAAHAPKQAKLPAVSAPPPSVHSFRDRVLLPDFRGLPRKQVMQVTAAGGLRVTLEGEGVAVSQDPPPGSVVLSERDTVRIVFGPASGSAAKRPAPGGRG